MTFAPTLPARQGRRANAASGQSPVAGGTYMATNTFCIAVVFLAPMTVHAVMWILGIAP